MFLLSATNKPFDLIAAVLDSYELALPSSYSFLQERLNIRPGEFRLGWLGNGASLTAVMRDRPRPLSLNAVRFHSSGHWLRSRLGFYHPHIRRRNQTLSDSWPARRVLLLAA